MVRKRSSSVEETVFSILEPIALAGNYHQLKEVVSPKQINEWQIDMRLLLRQTNEGGLNLIDLILSKPQTTSLRSDRFQMVAYILGTLTMPDHHRLSNDTYDLSLNEAQYQKLISMGHERVVNHYGYLIKEFPRIFSGTIEKGNASSLGEVLGNRSTILSTLVRQ